MTNCNFRKVPVKNKRRHYGKKPGLLLLLAIMTTAGIPLWAQTSDLTEKITLSLRQTNAQKVIEETDRQSHYAFMFAPELLEKILIDRIEVKALPLRELMNTLQKKYNLVFSVAGENIAVKPGTSVAPKKIAGKVTGVILDEEDGQPVAGATINIGDQTLVADMDGRYSLTLPKGIWEATISATGYGKKVVTDIQVKDDQAVECNVTLKRQKGQLAGVVVRASAKKESVASLYLRQKNAAGISDGISAEQIGRTPDKNIGEVLRRVNGVSTVDNKYVVVRGLSERYNGAMLNGQLMPSTELNRKQFSFNIIPSNLVDNVIVYKTITPDMSAEFGGGLVSVNTKALPSENFLTVTVGAGYDDKTTNKPFTGMLIENKQYFGAMPDNRKLMGVANWNSRKDVLQAFDPALFPNNWRLYQYKPKPSENFQLSGGRLIELKNEHRIGFMGSLSYRNTWQTQDVRMGRNGYDTYFPGTDSVASKERAGYNGKRFGFITNIGAMAGAGYQHRNTKITWQSLYLTTSDQQLVMGTGISDASEETVGFFDLFTYTRLWQHQLKGEHQLTKKGFKFNWTTSYLDMDKQRPDNHIFSALYANDGKDNPFSPVDFSISKAQSYLTDAALRTWNRAREKNVNWHTELVHPFQFNIGAVKTTHLVKAGYDGWFKQRSFFVINTSSGYHTGELQPLTSYFDSTLHPGGKQIEITNFGDDMNKHAALHAGYWMMDHKIAKRWRIVYGLRGEYYNLNKVNQILDSTFKQLNAGRVDTGQFDYSELRNREPNMNWFPSANITYSITPKMNLRLGYAKSIIRPDLRETSYFKEYDFELGGTYESLTPVRSTVMHHYDFRYEWYPAAGEVLSVSLFYKKLEYPMEIFKLGSNRQYVLRNNKRAKNKGVEVEIRKSFDFTKVPVLRNITLSGNFTWLEAYVTPMGLAYSLLDTLNTTKIIVTEGLGKEEKRPQTGAGTYMFNAGISYDTRLFSLTANYNHISNRMFRPDEIYRQSLFEQPLRALDAQLAVNLLKKKMQVKVNAGNLLKGKSLIYTNYYNADITNGIVPPSTKDLMYQTGDGIDYQAKPGRTWSLQLTYHL